MTATEAGGLSDAVREAWATVAAPPRQDMQYFAWGWGEEAARAFVGVAPIDVDIDSVGFHAATPLLDLPPRAAAAYLGPYLLSLLQGLERQKAIGIFFDVVTRAHTLTCLALPSYWERVIRPFVPPQCRAVLIRVIACLAADHEALALTRQQADSMLALATAP